MALEGPSIEELLKCLGRLEATNLRYEAQRRRFKGIVALLLIAGCAGFLMGQTRPASQTIPDRIAAHEFILQDTSGATLAQLVSGPGGGWLGLMDNSGRQRVVLGMDRDIVKLSFFNAKHGQQLVLAADEAIGSEIRLNRAKDEYVRVNIGAFEALGPRLRVLSADGKVVWSAPQ